MKKKKKMCFENVLILKFIVKVDDLSILLKKKSVKTIETGGGQMTGIVCHVEKSWYLVRPYVLV